MIRSVVSSLRGVQFCSRTCRNALLSGIAPSPPAPFSSVVMLKNLSFSRFYSTEVNNTTTANAAQESQEQSQQQQQQQPQKKFVKIGKDAHATKEQLQAILGRHNIPAIKIVRKTGDQEIIQQKDLDEPIGTAPPTRRTPNPKYAHLKYNDLFDYDAIGKNGKLFDPISEKYKIDVNMNVQEMRDAFVYLLKVKGAEMTPEQLSEVTKIARGLDLECRREEMRRNPRYSPISIAVGIVCGLIVALGMGWPGFQEYVFKPIKRKLGIEEKPKKRVRAR
eukprot:GEZU01015777.1.p1 GENE.GEZU01015777.1~~GEZU01015777.1.p1  ORF type:complete len:277 (-),score=83.32 GEZU01015777.1:172-1002(-)